MSHLLEFEECDTRRCVNVTINNDMTLEKVESFEVIVYFRDFLFFIRGGQNYGEIKIMDDDERKNLYT